MGQPAGHSRNHHVQKNHVCYRDFVLVLATPGSAFPAACRSFRSSDRRLKRDIRRIGTADNGLPI
jgi:hypothetical protein